MRNLLGALALLALSFPMIADDAISLPTRSDDLSIKVGATIFADFTWQEAPSAKDADGNEIRLSSFNVPRAYVNVTGKLNNRFSFRVTPDVAREVGGGSSLSGSQQFRLKYAYAELDLAEWLPRGSWVRFGVQQTPYADYFDKIYRYRFQGTNFVEREGYLSSADAGIAFQYALPASYGEIHAGFYNGEGYSKVETNDRKSLQIRASVRPLPKSAPAKGLRATVFYNGDHYMQTARRERLVGQLTFEHARVHAGVDAVSTRDQSSMSKPEIEGRGWSVFVTPRLGKGWELLLRHDENKPDRHAALVRERNITGIAYWLPNLKKFDAAVLFDRDSLSVTGKEDDTRYGLKMLLAF